MKLPNKLVTLKAEIVSELSKLTILIEKLRNQLNLDLDDSERIESAALRLHNFYTGCENIFKLIATEINGFKPDGLTWYKRLLTQMALPVEGIRPAVISEATEKILMENLAFRHIVRNIYGYELDPERIRRLLQITLNHFPIFSKEIGIFCQFLENLTQMEP